MNKALEQSTAWSRERRRPDRRFWAGLCIAGILLCLPPEPAAGQCQLAGSNVVSATAVNAVFVNGEVPRRLSFADGCRAKIHPNIGVPTFGIEIEAELPQPRPTPVTVHVKFQSNEGTAAPVEFHLMRQGHVIGSQNLVKRWSLESDGTTDRTIDLSALASQAGVNLDDYIRPGDRVVFRLLAFPVMVVGGNCDESFEFDRGG